MPSTKYFCAAKNRMNSGVTEMKEIAINFPQFTTDSESRDSLRAREMV